MFKPKKRIIYNTGKHLPKATMNDWLELQNKRHHLVTKPILKQSRKQGTVLYGAHAVNAIVGPRFSRHTYDYDIYSHHPLRHAKQIERSIDHGTNSDLAYIEKTQYPFRGNMKPLWRVKIRTNDTVEADYNRMPMGIRIVTKRGVRYESLRDAKSKYRFMNRNPSADRTAYGELYRIEMFEKTKRRKRI